MNTFLKAISPLLLIFLIPVAALAQVAPQGGPPNPNLPEIVESNFGAEFPGGVGTREGIDSNRIGSSPGYGLPGGADPSAKIGPSSQLSAAGDALAKNGDWLVARSKYQSALDLWPDNKIALYGMAKCAESEGDTAAAIGFYRTAIYSHDPKVYGTVPGDGYQTNDVGKMMEFIITPRIWTRV